MTKYYVKFRKSAAKYYAKLTPKLKYRVNEIIERLSENPYEVVDIKPLEGTNKETFRIRIGSLRLLYQVRNEELVIIVLDLGPRGDIYK